MEGTKMKKGALAALALLSLVLGGPAQASSGAWAKSEHVSARLVSAVEGTGDLATVPAGLEIALEGDWKTYWRSPGEAGLPPALDWKGSQNLASATLLYPAPHRITVLGIDTFGYKHDVVFPLDLKVADKGKPLDLRLSLDMLVCAEQCIPKHFDLALDVPSGAPTPDADAQLLAKARAEVPGDSRTSGLAIAAAEEVSDKGKPALEVKATSDQPFGQPDLIPEIADVTLGAPRVAFSADRRAATFDLPLARPLPVGARLTGRPITLTLTDGPRALEQKAEITQGASALEEEPGPSLSAMLAIALLGGLILNLMPCVLPVLSLKFISVVSQGGRAPAAVRAGFLATAAGIIGSFLAIAGALIAVKAAGHSVNWGLQFQMPAFIAAMAVLVTVFACNLAGLFEVPLPRFVASAASSRTGPDESLAGHFVTGVFATLLATPCSAPFLGTAVGFALAGSPGVMLGIFLALGVGLALPYLAVAAVPRLAAALPRPGKWMQRLRQLMALPLAATAVWLVTILVAQVSLIAGLSLALLLVAIALLLYGRGRLPDAQRGIVMPVVTVLGLAAILMPSVIAIEVGKRGAAIDDGIAWTAFDRDRIRSLVSQGKTVFVDVTADWCLTCQANRRFVLAKGDVAKRLNDRTVSMQADWTRPDPAIGAYLASYGRYGIPFNIVYGPAAPGGVVLPELLTVSDVDAALDKASGTRASAAERTFASTEATRP
ncbi:putative Thiol:disulfide interchange protein [Beijerinckiaceae bacterium RH AL1]|nr:putative Thiol:disulfide interchange protein [Beijerinckiaceae bacterium RH CH11]VVB46240.1 putative Thiol:disulfide interchange protein [Beijerinckiaceae bacterium RH AL8]VVC55231.1 putative Thiol:disulfide interchange protein [Beijerinckiaceae bacterium RH AL1]